MADVNALARPPTRVHLPTTMYLWYAIIEYTRDAELPPYRERFDCSCNMSATGDKAFISSSTLLPTTTFL